MKKLRRVISWMLTFVMVLGICKAPLTVSASERTANECIADLIGYYKSYQESAATDIERVLDELKTIDEAAYEDWKEIMDFWSFANTDMVVSRGVGPDGMPEDDSLCIVVLGFALNADGTMKEELINRLEVGLATAEKYPNAYVAVTGGGTAANNPNVTEGGLMGEWMLEQGLDPDRLIVENRAPSTVGNALMTYTLLVEEYPMVDSVCMVTSDYHVPRGCIIFNSKFVLAATEAGTKPISIVGYAGCETGSNGYESISLQASGVSQVAGVNPTSGLTLSALTGLTVTRNAEHVAGNELDITVTASYDTGYVRDVTDLVTVEGFDASLDADQTITVSYTENGITVEGTVSLADAETVIVGKEHLGALIEEVEAKALSSYTQESVAALNEALAVAKEVYESTTATAEDVDAAYAALTAAIAGLKTKLNVAYGATVTVNCNQANAYKIVDGSTGNYWESVDNGSNVAAEDAEFVIDLNGTCNVDSIVVVPYYGNERYYEFNVLVSEDGENWELVAEERPTEAAAADGYTYSFEGGKVISYVKVEGVGVYHPTRPDINNIHIKEVFVYGEEIGNIALNKPVLSSGSDQSASSSSGAVETKVNDGNRATYWDAGKYANRPWVAVELGDVYNLEKVNVINYISTSRYYQYEIYTSVNGVDYELLAAKDNTDVSIGAGYEHDATGVQAAYIKVVGTYNSANSAFHISEIRAYGEVAAVDKAELTELVYACNDVNKDLYTPDSLPAYEAALTAAHIVMNDENATQLDVEKALYNLKTAVAGLVEKVCVELVTQPADVVVTSGTDAVVTFEAIGDGLTYTWYYKNPGNVKFYKSGDTYVDENTYTIPMYSWRDGQQVYCVVTDAYGNSVQTNVVTLSMKKADVEIVTQPQDVTVETFGDVATVTVEAIGEDLTYTWYYKNPGNVKFYVSGDAFVDGNTYTIPVWSWRNGQQVYCVITDANGLTVQTNTVTLYVAE